MVVMEFLRPSTLDEALEAKAARPDAVPLAGGTDLMVELNFDRRRPATVLDLTRIAELAQLSVVGVAVRIGATVPYARLLAESARLPGLAMAARTVASAQIRNRGTLGGNLGSGSPAGDGHPPLLACDAEVELTSKRGVRRVPVTEFFHGPGRTAVEDDELITAVLVPVTGGPQQFSKVGNRNAMVIAVCSFALALHPATRTVGTGIGSAGPVPLRAREAERFLASELDWSAPAALPDRMTRRFGQLVAAEAQPIDDIRGSAAYRRHALAVLARRSLTWVWRDYRWKARTECA
jgi:CO/xanthine dehydrogenase FAD-binding subunit